MTSTAHQVDTPAAPPRVSRRRVLGWGAATALVAGTGLLSYRAYDTAVLDPGGGPAHAPWRDWRDLPGPRGGLLVDAAEALVADEQQSLDNFAVVALPIAAVVLRSRPTETVSNTGKGV
jgi:hypothetical protein